MKQFRVRLAVALACLFSLTAAAEAQGFNVFSVQQDVEIGRQSAMQIERQLPMVGNRAVNDWVNQIGQRLVRNAPGPRFNYQFRVVNASDLNAFALPGGFIYLNRGVIESARTEGEVASVLAHEIAHVALRHGTHNASKAYATQAGLGILGGILGGKVSSNTAQVLNVVGGFGLNAAFLKYSRDAERQADLAGVRMLAAAGYDPYDMASFFRKLEGGGGRGGVSWLQSHPSPGSRVAVIEREAAMLGRRQSGGTGQLARMQSTLRSLGPARTTQQIARMGVAARR